MAVFGIFTASFVAIMQFDGSANRCEITELSGKRSRAGSAGDEHPISIRPIIRTQYWQRKLEFPRLLARPARVECEYRRSLSQGSHGYSHDIVSAKYCIDITD